MIAAISHGNEVLGVIKDPVVIPREGEYIRLSSNLGRYKVCRVTWLFQAGGETKVEVLVAKVMERPE